MIQVTVALKLFKKEQLKTERLKTEQKKITMYY